jgi:Protein of unknown function (DUF3892)
MSTYYVDKVHKSWNSSHTHEHIDYACVESSGTHWTPTEVVASLNAGNEWRTRGRDGATAKIRPLVYCPHNACYAKPYITTSPDHTTSNNLDNLPAC